MTVPITTRHLPSFQWSMFIENISDDVLVHFFEPNDVMFVWVGPFFYDMCLSTLD